MRTRSGTLGVLVLAGLAVLAGPVSAQITPGAVRSTLPEAAKAPVRPQTQSQASRPSRPNIADTGPQILIKRFDVSGNNVVGTEVLQELLAPHTNKRLSLIGIYDIADGLTEFYRQQGFSVASVNVPAQKVSDGVVKFVVLEGRVGKVDVEGNKNYSFDFIRERVSELKPGSYLKGDVLRRNMLHLKALPGVSAKAIVQPGAEFGDSDVVVKVEEDPYDVAIRVDNYGRTSIGQMRGQADLFIHNPTGIGDQLTFSGLSSAGLGLKYGAAGYSLPVGTEGARWQFNFSRHFYEVNHEEAGALELTGDGFSARTGISYPIIRGAKENFSAGAWYSHTKSDSNSGAGGATAVTRDKLNQIIVGLNYDRAYASGAASSAAISYATNFNRNTDFQSANVTTDNAQLGKFELSASHIRPLYKRWLLLSKMSGVLSLGPLMEIERFRVGGPNNVRGFPASEIAGDSGFQFTLEAQRPFSLGKGMPAVFKTFFDTGLVYRMSEPRNLSGEKPTTSLTSIGVGISVSYAQHYSFDLEAATPLNAYRTSDDTQGGKNGRIWASFNALF